MLNGLNNFDEDETLSFDHLIKNLPLEEETKQFGIKMTIDKKQFERDSKKVVNQMNVNEKYLDILLEETKKLLDEGIINFDKISVKTLVKLLGKINELSYLLS